MATMRTRRALIRAVRGRRSDQDAATTPAYWGRIGAYDAVTRDGVLYLLSPEPRHPSLRVGTPSCSD